MSEITLEIVRPKLATYQERILYNDSRFNFTEASTKIGKTFCHIWWIYERAHEDWNEPGFQHWWTAPTIKQTSIAFNRLRRSIAHTGLYNINESKRTITCPNGAIIAFQTAEIPDNLYGEDVHSIVFDEAPRARQEAFIALRSTITATGGVMKLIGNFGGISNWMHQLKEKAMYKFIDGVETINEKGDPQYSYAKINVWQAVEEGILEEAEIRQAQKDLAPKIFRQLYMAEEMEEDDQLCSYSSIMSLWTNTHADKGERYLTADIALHGSDKFVLMVWDGLRIIHCRETAKCEANEVEQILKSTAEEFKVKRGNIVYDADGLGSFLRGYLQGAVPFNNGATPIKDKRYKNLKSECGYKLAEVVNQGKILIECELPKTEIIAELECLQSFKLDDDGKIQLLPKAKIKERIGRSPDYLDTLTMRMYFMVGNKGSYSYG